MITWKEILEFVIGLIFIYKSVVSFVGAFTNLLDYTPEKLPKFNKNIWQSVLYLLISYILFSSISTSLGLYPN